MIKIQSEYNSLSRMDPESIDFDFKLRSLVRRYLSDEDGVYSRITFFFYAKFVVEDIPIYSARIVNRLSLVHRIRLTAEVLEACKILLAREGSV